MRFNSGLAGALIVTLALMGSIMVGFLLNGTTNQEEVTDYDYVTDVTGLYDYTPVPSYSNYSPAENNYQYATSVSNLGTYTDGINFTKSGAANLNPIITPESGYTTTTKSIEDLFTRWSTGNKRLAYSGGPATNVQYNLVTPQELLDLAGGGVSAKITTPRVTFTAYGGTTFQDMQEFTLIMKKSGSTPNSISEQAKLAVENKVGAIDLWTGPCYIMSTNSANSPSVGFISNLSINSNGTVTYDYSHGSSVSHESLLFEQCNFVYWKLSPQTDALEKAQITTTNYINVDFLDANDGVSLSGDSVYWSNGNELGSVSWMFKKPTEPTELTFTTYGADNAPRNAWTVGYNGDWYVKYTAPDGFTRTNTYGGSWKALQVTDWYTGQLQVTPVKTFNNFTSYVLGNTNTYTMKDTSEQTAISYVQIQKNKPGVQNFACTGTQIRTGNVAGAMFDPSFTVSKYFPEMANVRINFDSAAYIGTSVTVGSWTMTTDFNTFTGKFNHTIDDKVYEYTADLTQPFNFVWTFDNTVEFTFYQPMRSYTTTLTIQETAPEKVVSLGGQWVVDTDLYEVGSHLEDVYDWNIGNWGLDQQTFIITTMGLTALLAIAFRLMNVPIGGLDLVVLFGANVILWIVL